MDFHCRARQNVYLELSKNDGGISDAQSSLINGSPTMRTHERNTKLRVNILQKPLSKYEANDSCVYASIVCVRVCVSGTYSRRSPLDMMVLKTLRQ